MYVAGPDCSIREVDVVNNGDSTAADSIDANVAPVIKEFTLRGHGGPITRLALSPNGQYLAAASLDARVRIHHLSSLRFLSALPFTELALTTGDHAN